MIDNPKPYYSQAERELYEKIRSIETFTPRLDDANP
jgi:hypothetical protein